MEIGVGGRPLPNPRVGGNSIFLGHFVQLSSHPAAPAFARRAFVLSLPAPERHIVGDRAPLSKG
jgi:hypothetical protein